MSETCNVCKKPFGDPILDSAETRSLTTMNAPIDDRTVIYFCLSCQHTQTRELPDLVDFYASKYEINLDSDDEDQLYDVFEGKQIYRSDHQAQVLMSKIDLSQHRRVLDYGCAKAPSLQAVCKAMSNIEPYLFDVTDKYVPFWEKFPTKAQWSIHELDPNWTGRMDVVLAFYALEHTPELSRVLGDVKKLLVEGGYFYFLVPNMYQNAVDFATADHVNHFSEQSLWRLMADNGFTDIEIDDFSHAAAFIVSARFEGPSSDRPEPPTFPDRSGEVRALADFWGNLKRRITDFETSVPADVPLAIYGAGVYGNFVLSCLNEPGRVACFLDQNKFLQDTDIAGVRVIAPKDFSIKDAAVIVGLNPRNARRIVGEVPGLVNKRRKFFYL